MIEKDLQIKITDYIDNNMSNEDRVEFEQFLKENEELRREIKDLESMLSDIKEIEPLKLGSSFDERLKRSVDSYDRSQSSSFNIFKLFDNPIYASAGAIAAVFLVVAVTILNFPSSGNGEGEMIIESGVALPNIEEVAEDNGGSNINDVFYEGKALNKTNNSQKKTLVEDSNDN